MASDTHILHRQINSALPVAVKGQGVYIIDSDGKRYLDASGGAAVSCLGHSHPRVIQAIKDQVDNIAFTPIVSGPTIISPLIPNCQRREICRRPDR